MQRLLSNTRFVRIIMQKYGKSQIFTNKYVTCRTVKCYGQATETQAMVKDILTQLNAIGVSATVTYTKKQHSWGAAGTIIRLPLYNFA